MATSSSCAAPTTASAATIRLVIDGDTVVLTDGRHIRLTGINATELGHGHRPDQPYAMAAKRALEKLLAAQGKHVELVVGRQRKDHYGRTLAYLFSAQRQDLGATLIQRGLAVAVAIPPNITRAACYFAAERQARHARLGIWSPHSPLLRAAGTLSQQALGFFILTGRVTAVSRHGRGERLVLDNHVWLWVEPNERHYFSRPFADYRDKQVLVRGWIHRYAGHAEMQLPHPADITGY